MSAGDYQLGDTIYLPFTTRAFATGVPTVLAGTPVIEIYEDASVTQITSAETLVVSIDSVVGFNMCSVVVSSGNGFGVGQSYTAIISTGTVGGVSVVGEVIGHFTVEMSAAHLRLGSPAGASVSVDIAAVPTVVQNRTEMDSNSTRLATLAGGIIEGATSGTPTTTSTNTDLTGFATGELVDRVIVFTGGTANGQAASILTYTATNGVVTFAALTTAPAASDPFKII